MGGWFTKLTMSKGKAKAKTISKVIPDPHSITDPNILRKFEDQIYGIELTSTIIPKQKVSYQPITQPVSSIVI